MSEVKKITWHDEKLIELVRNYPSLYDLSNPKYTDIQFKNTIWSKIGEEMNTTGASCKTRWSNIRDNFRKSMKKNITVSGQKAKTVKHYKYSEQLSFLKKFFEHRDTMSNIDTEDIIHDDIVEQLSRENEENTQDNSTAVTAESQSDIVSKSKQIVLCGPTPPKKKKLLAPNDQPPKTAAATVMEYLVNKNETTAFSTQHHPVDAFLLGLAPVLKKLTPRQWHFAKSEIFATVQNYEFKMLTDQEAEQVEPSVLSSTPVYFQQSSPIGSYHNPSSTPSIQSNYQEIITEIKTESELNTTDK